jgi:putative Holliday junction resolvase
MVKLEEKDIVMGFDFGSQKIGVAVGQLVTSTATPISIIKAKNGIPDWDEIRNLIEEWKPSLLVVGFPINMDGTESEMSRLSQKFGRKLNGRFNLPFEMMDERLTSFEARQAAKAPGEQIDDVAAKIILESFFGEVSKQQS